MENALPNMRALRETVAILRSPEGCPWDREQTHKSLTQHLIDECSELLEAIDKQDLEHMREELGDVLLQVVLHAQIASEQGVFDLDAVAAGIQEKLIRRHPHVFGDPETRERLNTADKVLVEWDKIKKAEKEAAGKAPEKGRIFKELPPRLPALLFALHVTKQIQKKEVPVQDYLDPEDIENQAANLDEQKLGERLFELVAAARVAGVDPEAALRRYTEGLMERLEREREAVTPR